MAVDERALFSEEAMTDLKGLSDQDLAYQLLGAVDPLKSDCIAELSRRYTRSLMRFLVKSFGGSLTEEDFEEVVQDTYMTACDDIEEWDTAASKLLTWLCGIAWHRAHKIIDQRGAAKRDDGQYVQAEALPDTAAHGALTAEILVRLETEISKWPPLEQVVARTMLVWGDGDENDGLLAERHGSTVNSIRVIRSRVKKKIMEFLGVTETSSPDVKGAP
jgi:DNA-directed RNA polymerase specialized sigma24 family protein